MLRTNFQPRSRGHHAEIISMFSSLWLARREAKARDCRGCCCGSPAGYLRGHLSGCVAVLAVGCVLCAAVLMWYRDVALCWPVGHAELLLFVISICWSCFRFAFRFSTLNSLILAIGCRSCIFSEPKKRRTCLNQAPISALFFLHFDFRFSISMLFGHNLTSRLEERYSSPSDTISTFDFGHIQYYNQDTYTIVKIPIL